VSTVAYYPAGAVHMRNLDLLAGALPGCDFRVLYRSSLPWVEPGKVAEYGYPYVLDDDDRPPADLLNDASALVISIAALEPMVCDLIEAAYERDVPVIAIEEVVQIALNQGAITHYLMPVDRLALASDYERDRMAGLGVAEHKMAVTGWPFYSGLTSPPSLDSRIKARAKLGLAPNSRIAALCLSRLNEAEDLSALESPQARAEILDTVREGVPDSYEVVVKLHPAENSQASRREIAARLPGATVVAGGVSIGDVLDAADVCLTRGNSQVALEALLRDMPVHIIPCGIPTLFDDAGDALIVRTGDELRSALTGLDNGRRPDAGPVMQRHLPFSPAEALARTASIIEETVSGESPQRTDRDWLELAAYRGFLGEPERALAIIGRRWPQARPPIVSALARLLSGKASAGDIESLVADADLGTAYIKPVIIGLWIDQLDRRGPDPDPNPNPNPDPDPDQRNLDVIEKAGDFPPNFNRHDFVGRAAKLGRLYLRAGRLDEAEAIVAQLAGQFGTREDVRSLAGKLDLRRGRVTRRSISHIGRWAGQGLRRRIRTGSRPRQDEARRGRARR
jgi:hypothetical protein